MRMHARFEQWMKDLGERSGSSPPSAQERLLVHIFYLAPILSTIIAIFLRTSGQAHIIGIGLQEVLVIIVFLALATTAYLLWVIKYRKEMLEVWFVSHLICLMNAYMIVISIASLCALFFACMLIIAFIIPVVALTLVYGLFIIIPLVGGLFILRLSIGYLSFLKNKPTGRPISTYNRIESPPL